MEKKEKPSQARLKELFHYDPETGIFTRKKPSPYNPKERKYGRQGAGRISELGYVLLMIDGINYIAGSAALAYVNGEWPKNRIKYIDGNKLNNRVENIRVHDKHRAEIKAQKLTQSRLKELLHYEPDTGWFTWRVYSSIYNPGDRAGGLHGRGYRSIGVDYKKYLEHSLAWLYMTGVWPPHEVDHINRAREDNRWTNLRAATRSQNGHNKGMHKANGVGFPGVGRHGNKYRSRMYLSGKIKDYGCFPTIAQARIARLLGEKAEFGHFTTWVQERDGILPIGDKFMVVIVRDNRLYLLDDKQVAFELTDIKDFEVLPITDDGHVIQ